MPFAGPEDAKIVIGNLTQGQTFDQGSVCANENSGYIFVQSNCTTSTDVSVVFQQSTYKGPICLDLGGHHLSGTTLYSESAAENLSNPTRKKSLIFNIRAFLSLGSFVVV